MDLISQHGEALRMAAMAFFAGEIGEKELTEIVVEFREKIMARFRTRRAGKFQRKEIYYHG